RACGGRTSPRAAPPKHPHHHEPASQPPSPTRPHRVRRSTPARPPPCPRSRRIRSCCTAFEAGPIRPDPPQLIHRDRLLIGGQGCESAQRLRNIDQRLSARGSEE